MIKIYTPSHVANHVLDRAFAEGYLITQMKLQKLVYIEYGWVLAVLDRKLFDEPIYAWEHGPVIRSLYDEFKHYGDSHIDTNSMDFNFESAETSIPRIPESERDGILLLNKVWDVYKDFRTIALRDKAREQGTPWYNTYEPGKLYSAIPDDRIKSHFEHKITEYLKSARQAEAA